ncbi:XRE family transcriptional regulator [Neptunicoccus cionae]|uniref:XRE family transcriptional regulator n=1 Tax=Neptunicoccus cionae TaxID=2035344 RepID=UPI001E5E041F|nr:XRE family transcriptional regulator [Amylibacter cionae]
MTDLGIKTYLLDMEEFIREIEAYANAVGKRPGTVVQDAKCGGGRTWARWKLGDSSPTLAIVDRIRAYMSVNQPNSSQKEDAA